MDKEEMFITSTELCKWLRVNKSTVSRWRDKGMPHYGKDRAYRYKKSEVIKWLEEQGKKEN